MTDKTNNYGLNTVKIFLVPDPDKIKIAVEKEDGTLTRIKDLIDEVFLSAKRYISIEPDRTELMVLTFSKNGELITVQYNPAELEEKSRGIIKLLELKGLAINVSRSLKKDAEKQLISFFKKMANEEKIPYKYGYYKDENDNWRLARPDEKVMVDLLNQN